MHVWKAGILTINCWAGQQALMDEGVGLDEKAGSEKIQCTFVWLESKGGSITTHTIP